ncbi:MAG: flagellar hook-basal body complex protein, partial [bacterium]
TSLQFETDENTGLITGLAGIGGGGITVVAAPTSTSPAGGLNAGTLVIDTEDTTYTASIATYDSLGTEHVLNFTYTKTADSNIWTWEAEVDSPAQMISGYSGTISFNNDGSLASMTYNGGVTSLTFNPNTGASLNVSISLDTGDAGGLDGITQYANATSALTSSQDGYGMGNLVNVSIDQSGKIVGTFSNNQILNLAQIVLAGFQNPQGLLKQGSNLYGISSNSGDPVYGLPEANVNSSIHSGYVEMSNVEISSEFADMILAQRGFQASTQIIQTADRILEEVIRLKRI